MTLKEYLQKYNISYAEFGRLIGRTKTSVYLYASGKGSPTLKTLQKITQVTKGKVTQYAFNPKGV